MRKFDFHAVVFDLETTDTEPREIIEIGATILDPKLAIYHYPEHVDYSSLVRPTGPVSDFVYDLTKIDRVELSNAREFADVAQEFERWIANYAPIKKCRLAAWGNYFDVSLLRAEYARKCGWLYPFSGTAVDVKTIALAWSAMAGRRTDSLSVKSAAEALGIPDRLGINKDAIGYHRAGVDATMTAEIYRECLRLMSGGVYVDGKYVKVGAE